MFRSPLTVLFFSALFALLLYPSVPAQADKRELKETSSDEEVEHRLKEIQLGIVKEQDKLKVVKKERKVLETELRQVEEIISKAEIEKTNLYGKVKILNTAIGDLEQEIGSQHRILDRLNDIYHKRLVGIYKMKKQSSSFDYLFKAGSATDLLKRSHYLTVVARYDRQLLMELKEIIASFEKSRQALGQTRDNRQEKIEKLQTLLLDLERDKAKQGRLLKEQLKKQKKIEVSISQLRRTASKLQKVVNVLIAKGEKKIKKSETAKAKAKGVAPVVFKGGGLRRKKGKLPFPVDGKIVRKFGKRKHEKFSDILFSKGLEVLAGDGAKVAAVEKGKVILSRVLPGYGKVLILDHGLRYYSLYGRLDEIDAKLGNIAEQKTILAKLGEEGEKGSNFYFEIRYKGKAINPAPYFRDLPK